MGRAVLVLLVGLVVRQKGSIVGSWTTVSLCSALVFFVPFVLKPF
jgi:hypothetical protein